LKPVYDFQNRGTYQGILISKLQDLHHFLSVGVGVFPTSARTIFIYRAIVVGAEEGTGGGFDDVVFVLIDAEVFFDKVAGLHAEGFGEAVDVGRVEDGAGGLAAIGAGQTVGLFEDGFMEVMKGLVHLPGIFSLEPQEELLVFRCTGGCCLLKPL
jgi:hypothetical protein